MGSIHICSSQLKAEGEQVGDGIFPHCVAEAAWVLLDLEGRVHRPSAKRLVKKKSSLRQSLKGRKTMGRGTCRCVCVLGVESGKESKNKIRCRRPTTEIY